MPAFDAAFGALRALDTAQVCAHTGAQHDSASGRYSVRYLGQTAQVDARDGAVYWEVGAHTTPLDALVLVHYLGHADGTAPTGEWLSLHEMAPTAGWAQRIIKTCAPPLATAFGNDMPAFFFSAEKLGGQPLSGDTALVPLLPFIPLYITIWQQDDEFPADARILVDRTLPHQLPGEDRLVVPQLALAALLRCAGKPFVPPRTEPPFQ
jgi:hypothetical protein